MTLEAIARDPQLMARGLGLFDEPIGHRVVIAARELQPWNVATVKLADPQHADLPKVLANDRRQGDR